MFECIERLEGEYERIYYTGIAHERRGMASLRSNAPGSGFMAFELLGICYC